VLVRIAGVPRLVIGVEDARRGLPRRVGVGLRWASDDGVAASLLPLEVDCLGPGVVAARRLHFTLGRAAARDALAELGLAGAETLAIGRGAAGEPVWPAGVVGAISHAGDVAIAIVGRRTDYVGLGVDVEDLARGITARAMRLVATPAEQAWLAGGPDVWRLMLFSAKEAVFKALYPIERVWLGFSDAELSWDAEREVFVARLRKDAGAGHPAGSTLEVRSRLTESAVLSTAFAPAAGGTARSGG
jgi:enterobactin synthetase component D